MKLLLHLLSTAEAKCFLSVAHVKITGFPQVRSARVKAVLPLQVCAQRYKRMEQPIVAKSEMTPVPGVQGMLIEL